MGFKYLKLTLTCLDQLSIIVNKEKPLEKRGQLKFSIFYSSKMCNVAF